MTPKFVQPCFIRKNTPELRKKLEELGYVKNSPNYTDNDNNIFAYQYPIKGFDTPSYVVANSFDIPFDEGSVLKGMFIDCGTNKALFIAIAALREDSDRMQWFCDDEPNEYKSLFLCEYDDVNEHIHNKMDGWDCEGFHKATVEELIEHFKE